MKKFLLSFKNKKFRHGTFSLLTAVVDIAILLFVNLVAGQLKVSFDLTSNKLYSLSEDSLEILDELTMPITIYPLFRTGVNRESNGLDLDLARELLREYDARSRNVTVEYKDPVLNPGFVAEKASGGDQIPNGSIIVESPLRRKVIPAGELLTTEFDYNTFQTNIKSMDIEPQVSNAILYVSTETTPVIYRVSNHQESPVGAGLEKQLSLANYELADLNLLQEDIPEDCRLLLITTPQRDWSPDEADKAKAYLEKGGRAFVALDPVYYPLDNLYGVMAVYGLEFNNAVVYEGDTRFFQQYPTFLYPGFLQHDITVGLLDKNFYVFLPQTQPVTPMELRRNSTKLEPFFVSSSSSYGKTNPNPQSLYPEDGDIPGPFILAAAVTDTYYVDNTTYFTKIIVIGNSSVLDDRVDSLVSGGNFQFAIDAINWTQDKTGSIYIRPKTQTMTYLQMTQSDALLMLAFSVLVIPVAVFATGFVIWFRRRNS